LAEKFLDLGAMPPSNAFLSEKDLEKPEPKYPLRLLVCTSCWLVQTEDFVGRDQLFASDYAYFSSTSSSWLEHAASFCEKIIRELGLGPNSFVIEIGSNDGYLLKNFLNAGIPCLGIEPTGCTAATAEALGIPVMREFFDEKLGRALAAKAKQADLIIGNNVFAHVPDINDFTLGLKAALKPNGTITLEFPHLMRLIEQAQFDTVYHEHFSYLSLYTAERIFNAAGLRVWDVKQLTTHGGSLRIYGCHHADSRATSPAVAAMLAEEAQRGLQNLTPYQQFQARADKVEDDLLSFLRDQRRAGKKVAAYGAAAKGNTLLNYGQIQPDLLPVVCDAAPSKQGKFLPGSRIPVQPPEFLKNFDPDVVLVLPWNLAREIRQVCAAWVRPETKFIKAVPALTPA
jgi:SAM-dependent methyltransferase